MIETVVKVDGMMCGMCESHVNDAVRKAFPEAKKVASSHTKGQTVIHSEQALDEAKLRDVINALRGVLANDPRPSYQHDPARVYGMEFGGLEVHFTVDDPVLTVRDITRR